MDIKMKDEQANIESRRIILIGIVALFLVWTIVNKPHMYCLDILKVIWSNICNDGNTDDVNDIEREFLGDFCGKYELVDISGLFAKIICKKEVYDNLYVDENMSIVNSYKDTSTDYEFEQISGFYDFLSDNGVKFLYVNMPVKVSNDESLKQFGIESYGNQNADLLVKRLRESGIPTMDLREKMASEKIEPKDMFYRTDHHWNTKSGLWATQLITEGLNEYCGYDIDTSIYDIENYEVKEWKECWLGEQGCKIGKSYVGLDDYCEIKPKFDTKFKFRPIIGDEFEGTFDGFIDESRYDLSMNKYDNDWYYSYSNICATNYLADEGKIMFLTDSFGQVVEPFLALSVRDIDSLILRDFNDYFSLRDYILMQEYDTVVIGYSQLEMGGHDDPKDSNYRMFKLDN